MRPSSIVVGAGLFGCYAAIVLASRGEDVTIVDQDPRILSRASFVNQARVHTGLHYPRSRTTATEALARYRRFRERFEACIVDFPHIYAIATWGSKTAPDDLHGFADSLGLQIRDVPPNEWFRPGTVGRAFLVEEPAFDAATLRELLSEELSRLGVRVLLERWVVGASGGGTGVQITLDDGDRLRADRAILATYSATNEVRRHFGLEPWGLSHELTEVILGKALGRLSGRGFTVMDGPFWSMMPFGKTGRSSLTSVGFTPLRRAEGEPVFPCQTQRSDCTSSRIQDCNRCPVAPPSALRHHLQQMSSFLLDADDFDPQERLLTVKTILKAADVDDARPTVVETGLDGRVVSILSGKVSTVLDLEEALP